MNLAREYYKTHDPEIPEQIFELASQLRRWTIEGTIPKSVFSDVSLRRGIEAWD
jgi:hypothetical protein